jgi:hypothetical protein
MMNSTANQLGLAPMRIPKMRASWIDPPPIRASSQAEEPLRRGRASPKRSSTIARSLLTLKEGMNGSRRHLHPR